MITHVTSKPAAAAKPTKPKGRKTILRLGLTLVILYGSSFCFSALTYAFVGDRPWTLSRGYDLGWFATPTLLLLYAVLLGIGWIAWLIVWAGWAD